MTQIDLEPSEYRTSAAAQRRSLMPALLIVAGIWAGVVIGFARAYHSDAPLLVAIVSLGPGAILWGLAVLRD